MYIIIEGKFPVLEIIREIGLNTVKLFITKKQAEAYAEKFCANGYKIVEW